MDWSTEIGMYAVTMGMDKPDARRFLAGRESLYCIAQLMGVQAEKDDLRQLAAYLRRHGLRPPRMGSEAAGAEQYLAHEDVIRRTPAGIVERRKRVAELAAQNMTRDEIAYTLGLTYVVVRDDIKHMGIKALDGRKYGRRWNNANQTVQPVR